MSSVSVVTLTREDMLRHTQWLVSLMMPFTRKQAGTSPEWLQQTDGLMSGGWRADAGTG